MYRTDTDENSIRPDQTVMAIEYVLKTAALCYWAYCANSETHIRAWGCITRTASSHRQVRATVTEYGAFNAADDFRRRGVCYMLKDRSRLFRVAYLHTPLWSPLWSHVCGNHRGDHRGVCQ